MVHLQGAFTVDIEKVLVYYVGTQQPPQRVLEDPEVIALLNPQPNEVAKQLQGLKTVCVVLSEELGEVKEELAQIAKGDTAQLLDRIGKLEQQGWRQTEEEYANSGAGGGGDTTQLLNRIGRLEQQILKQTEESGAMLAAMKKERVEQEKAHKKAMQKLEQQREELLVDCARQVEEVKAHFMGILHSLELGKSPLQELVQGENTTQATSKSHKRKQGATPQQESQVKRAAIVISPPSTVRSVIPDSQSTDGGLSFLEEEGGRRRSLRSEQIGSQPSHPIEIMEETEKRGRVRSRKSGVVWPDLEPEGPVKKQGDSEMKLKETLNEETIETRGKRMSQSIEIVMTEKQKTTRSTRRSGNFQQLRQ